MSYWQKKSACCRVYCITASWKLRSSNNNMLHLRKHQRNTCKIYYWSHWSLFHSTGSPPCLQGAPVVSTSWCDINPKASAIVYSCFNLFVGSWHYVIIRHSFGELKCLTRAGFRQGWALGPCTIWAPLDQTEALSGHTVNAFGPFLMWHKKWWAP